MFVSNVPKYLILHFFFTHLLKQKISQNATMVVTGLNCTERAAITASDTSVGRVESYTCNEETLTAMVILLHSSDGCSIIFVTPICMIRGCRRYSKLLISIVQVRTGRNCMMDMWVGNLA